MLHPPPSRPPAHTPSPTLSLTADPKKPARGVVLQYPGGDSVWCPKNASGFSRERTFSIELLCSPTQGTPAQFASSNVVEANVCDYRVQLKSLAGCPTTCITGSSMCNGNGICGFNTDTQKNQCFCNAGASGPQCAATPKASTALGAEGIILIIVCLMLAGVLGLVGYMFMRLRKLTVDPSAYGELQGKCAWGGWGWGGGRARTVAGGRGRCLPTLTTARTRTRAPLLHTHTHAQTDNELGML